MSASASQSRSRFTWTHTTSRRIPGRPCQILHSVNGQAFRNLSSGFSSACRGDSTWTLGSTLEGSSVLVSTRLPLSMAILSSCFPPSTLTLSIPSESVTHSDTSLSLGPLYLSRRNFPLNSFDKLVGGLRRALVDPQNTYGHALHPLFRRLRRMHVAAKLAGAFLVA